MKIACGLRRCTARTNRYESAELFDGFAERVGTIVSGRRTYEISNAWDGQIYRALR